MQTEIEIKFFVASDIQAKLSNLLNSLEIKESSQQQLGNVYFDTPTLALRRLDMGLRIRRCDAFAEQTIKCRGQVVGGLHARPEYNAPVSGDLPTLSAFPDEIWPTLTERDHIQQQLVAQFRTDFLRRHWLIAFEGAEIELAWDQGEIVGSQGRTAINELETGAQVGRYRGAVCTGPTPRQAWWTASRRPIQGPARLSTGWSWQTAGPAGAGRT